MPRDKVGGLRGLRLHCYPENVGPCFRQNQSTEYYELLDSVFLAIGYKMRLRGRCLFVLSPIAHRAQCFSNG